MCPDYKPLPNAHYGIVAKDPNWFQGYPDVEIGTSGVFVCVFRQSMGLLGRHHSIMYTFSKTGLRWLIPLTFTEPADESAYELWNIPKIQRLPDNTLEIMCDFHDLFLVQQEPCIFYWTSKNNGRKWDGPFMHSIYGIMPTDYVFNPANPNERVMGLHYRDPDNSRMRNVLYRSKDGGQSWWSEEVIAGDGKHDYMDACPVLIRYGPDDFTAYAIVAFIRDNYMQGEKGSPMLFTVSYDFGKSWSTPQPIPIIGHRPIAKLLQDGRIMMTYRDVGDCQCTAVWIAELNRSVLNPKVKVKFEEFFINQRFYTIEMEDQGTHFEDYGYSDWVQDPRDGSVVAVYHTRKGEESSYVKSVKFHPNDL
jgi:hypothetical protein